ncbi:hypothetical protein N9C62_10010 [Luminiphilus sp.]|nr:hypothetical protein [Luminiphilus sp.]
MSSPRAISLRIDPVRPASVSDDGKKALVQSPLASSLSTVVLPGEGH